MDSEMAQMEIDTKGLCILCLRDLKTDIKNQDRERTHHHHPPTTTPTSIKTIMQCLSITNVSKLTNLSSPSSLLDSTVSGWRELEHNVEMVVTLCECCSPLISQLSELVKEFEVIRMRIDNCVEAVRGRVAEAEGNHALKEEFRRRVAQGRNDAFDKLSAGASIEDNLRMEEENTCELILKESIPEVTLIVSAASEDSLSSAMSLPSQPQQEETPSNSASGLAPSPARLDLRFQSKRPVVATKDASNTPTSCRMRLRHTKGATTSSRSKCHGRPGLRLSSTTLRQQDVCNTCGKKFTARRNFKYHNLIHGGVKPPQDCEYCGKTFTDRNGVQTHIVSVHRVEYLRKTLPPGCAAPNESQLKKVLNMITDNSRRNKEEFPHRLLCPCPSPFCKDKTFQKKSHLRGHIVLIHPDAIIAKIKKITGLTNRVNGIEGPSTAPAPIVGDHDHTETFVESEEEVHDTPERKRIALSLEGTDDTALQHQMVQDQHPTGHHHAHQGLGDSQSSEETPNGLKESIDIYR